MNEYENERELIDYLNVLLKRKWLIIVPTFVLVVAVGVYSFFLPRVWEVDAIIQPSKYIIQTEDGAYNEIIVVDPKQIAGRINEESYNNLIAAELNLDIREFPKLKAENLKDTKLLKISTRVNDVEKAKLILYSLFKHLKRDLDKKIDVEIKSFDTKISTNENLIKQNKLIIKDKLGEIKLNQIEKNITRQKILSAENKLKISEDRVNSIMEEMKSVKKKN
jgi:LPS O-antigen subunit length determinant protein (WzzB/FepE family)